MSLISAALNAFETAPVGDGVRRAAVSFLVSRAGRRLAAAPRDTTQIFAREMSARAVAEHTDAANQQHYEVPAAFFQACLGPRLKYSCCLYDQGADTLAAAEEHALAQTCANADLRDGQDIIELGCGWGSLTLWMAAHYPNARITAVSNSQSQRLHIERAAAAAGFANVRIITADMNVFDTPERFDRIVSVEMFEHMSNWRALLTRCKTWLKPDGLMLTHVFAHKDTPYRFDVANRTDWIAQHFFTGGVMPSRDLIGSFPDLFAVEQDWWWSGAHYERTARDWLALFDANVAEIRPVLEETYGEAAKVWEHRWRLFFLATAGLFGHAGGDVWGVAHHRLRPAI